jgi:hypothetical protein
MVIGSPRSFFWRNVSVVTFLRCDAGAERLTVDMVPSKGLVESALTRPLLGQAIELGFLKFYFRVGLPDFPKVELSDSSSPFDRRRVRAKQIRAAGQIIPQNRIFAYNNFV